MATDEPLNVIYGLKLKDEAYPIRYVGLTSRGAKVRFREHRSAAANLETPLYRWIRKHGVDAIECVIIEEVSDSEELDAREIHWIKELATFIGEGHGGFNLTHGGTGVTGYDVSYALADSSEREELSEQLEAMLAEWRNEPRDTESFHALVMRIVDWYREPAAGESVTLEHFASLESSRRCSTCRLPAELLQQVEDARERENPIPFAVISRWLHHEGYEIGPLSLPNHWRRFHHVRED